MHKYSWLVALAPIVAMVCGSNNGNASSSQSPLPGETKSQFAYNSNPVVTADTQQAVISDLNNFGLEVLQSLAPPDQNFAVSPASGFTALTMTSDGAQGTTADEMKAVLYPDVALTDIQAATNQLEQGVKGCVQPSTATSDGSKQVVLNLANDVFIQKGFAIEQPFLDNLAVNYDSGLELVDFETNPDAAGTLINNWVANETDDLIKDLILPGTLDIYTRLVLVDALYLNASWLTAFDPGATKPQPFHGVAADSSTDFMNSTLTLTYAAGTGWVGVDIPYFGGSLVMTAVLPDSGQFDSIKANLNASWLTSYDTAAQPRLVSLALPKFTFTGNSVSWKSTLEQLGMVTLFDQNTSNLNGIAENQRLFVKDVLQKVYVEVAETGTKAAAATAVVVDKGYNVATSTPTPIYVTLNRPFLFFVREAGGPVLFAGQVVSLP